MYRENLGGTLPPYIERQEKNMMDVEIFQKKLVELRALAAGNGNCLNGEQVKHFFTGLDLNKEQLLHIFKYLKIQGITIEGISFEQENDASKNYEAQADAESIESSDAENGDGQAADEIPALSETESAYLQEYLDSLEMAEFDIVKAEQLFDELEKASTENADTIKGELTKLYLPVAAQIAAFLWKPELFLADLIQEANVYLLIALGSKEAQRKNDTWLRSEIRSGLKLFIEEQKQQDFEDECLVARVQNLESAVKDLSEGEDGEESKFSVNELAIILDMEVEEIEDVLRLTGDM
ncbi:MAG: hypothetical protein ACOX8M_04445 [Marvinbryantia sp.]